MNITHTCSNCGEYLEVEYELVDGAIRIVVPPCPCLLTKAQIAVEAKISSLAHFHYNQGLEDAATIIENTSPS